MRRAIPSLPSHAGNMTRGLAVQLVGESAWLYLVRREHPAGAPSHWIAAELTYPPTDRRWPLLGERQRVIANTDVVMVAAWPVAERGARERHDATRDPVAGKGERSPMAEYIDEDKL